MVRERGSSVRRLGDWTPVLRKKPFRPSSIVHGGSEGLFAVFVDDLPDAMEPGELHKMFAKFRVVKDVFIPRKRSRTGRRFGFVRYDCSVAAEVDILQTNGIWIHDKELKVKCADYARNHTRRTTTWGPVAGRSAGFSSSLPCSALDHSHQKVSFDQRLLRTEYSFGREVWLSFYGVPIHAWNVSTFCSIGNVWGEVVLIDEDTAKCARDEVQTHSSLRIGDDDKGGEVHEQSYGREDEQTHSSMRNEGDDDVAEGGDGFLGDRDAYSASFVEESHDEIVNGKEEEGSLQGVPLSARADLVLRAPDDSREHTDLRQFQGVMHGSGPGLQGQGFTQEVGPDEVRPMSFQDGPFLNPSGINLEVVLGDVSDRTCRKLSRVVTDDNHMEKSMGEGGPLSVGLLSGEERCGQEQRPGVIIERSITDDEYDRIALLDEARVNSQPDSCSLERPRKRGRPKKLKVIENLTVMAVGLPISTAHGAGKDQSWEGRAVQIQSTGDLDGVPPTNDERAGLYQDDNAGANSQLVSCRTEIPRRRGRSKKSKVIVKAVASTVGHSRSNLLGARQDGSQGMVDEADRLWKFRKMLGLVSSSFDEIVVEKIAELLAYGDLGK
ncbi:hypothetical protein Dimus_024310 [Dionaea muscipula]